MTTFEGEISVAFGEFIAFSSKSGGVVICRDGMRSFYRGCIAMPSFVDSHCHVAGVGEALKTPDLSSAKSEEECISIVMRSGFSRRGWLYAMGWNQENWEKKNFPTRQSLDSGLKGAPAFLKRADGHCAWVSSEALAIAGVNKNTEDPPGGKIIRDDDGRPTGLLVDNAVNLVEKFLPKYSIPDLCEFVVTGAKELARFGITEMHDMDVSEDSLEAACIADYSGRLQCKIFCYVGVSSYDFRREMVSSSNVKPLGIKLFMDGALGSRGAAMLEPYSDAHKEQGLALLTEDDVVRYAAHAAEMDYQTAAHAIGDKANLVLSKAFLRIRKEFPNAILRAEHAQIMTKEAINNYAGADAVISIQPAHYESDMIMAAQRLGARRYAERAYLWGSLAKAGLTLISGSDAPIEPPDALRGIHTLNTRANEAISLDHAFETYTTLPRKITHSSLNFAKGESADFVIVRGDKVAATYYNGAPIFEDGSAEIIS